MFSNSLENSGFLVPRTVPATAVIFTEVPSAGTRRKKDNFEPSENTHFTCPRPVLPIGQKLNSIHQTFSPIIDKIPETIITFQSKLTMLKAKILDQLGLQCVVPILYKPYLPFLSYMRCLLGLDNDTGFMSAPSCNTKMCRRLEIEEREITHRLRVPDFEVTDLRVRTLDNCFRDMDGMQYGTRILVKLVDDQSCGEPRYSSVCDELLTQNRVVMDTRCETPE